MGLFTSFILVGLLGLSSYSAQVDYDQIDPPDVYIFPTPRKAQYGPLNLPIIDIGMAKAVIVIPKNPSERLKAAAEDINADLKRIAPSVIQLPVMQKNHIPETFSTCILLGVAGRDPLIDQVLATNQITISEAEKHKQGYHIFVRHKEKQHFVILAGDDDQGTYWAAISFSQMFRLRDDGQVLAHEVQVHDWPAFAIRMSSVQTEHLSPEQCLPMIQKTLRLKLNTSCYSGCNVELNEYQRKRGFKGGVAYWAMVGIGKESNKLGVPIPCWSDKRILDAWADTYKRKAALKPGQVLWHDTTDAGWWNVYLDKFWSKRSEADRQAYPEENPARADVKVINTVYQAAKSTYPDIDVYITPPCYYESPWDDNLPRVEMLREYLRILGESTPEDIIWILEDRSAEDCVAYEKYMNRKIINYKYPTLDDSMP